SHSYALPRCSGVRSPRRVRIQQGFAEQITWEFTHMPRKKQTAETTMSEATTSSENGATSAGAPKSKRDAVRRALETLGKKAKPKAIREHILREFNIDMSLPHISTTKSSLVGKVGKRGRKKSAETAPPANAGELTFSLKDMREIKSLVDRIGPEK